MDQRQAGALTAIAGVLVALGTLMPWAKVISGFGSASISGLERGGLAYFIGGAGLLILLGGLEQWQYIGLIPGLAFATGAISVLTVIGVAYEWVTLNEAVTSGSNEFAQAAIGAGVYVSGLGAILGALANFASIGSAASSEEDSQEIEQP